MKYIRTKSKIYEVESEFLDNEGKWVGYNIVGNDMAIILRTQVIKQADTIEELCDEFLIMDNERCMEIFSNYDNLKNSGWYRSDIDIYGAIYTNKGLIYVAKMNEKGDLELI